MLSYIAFPKTKKLTALRDAVDAEFRKFAASGEYRRLLEQYRLENVQAPLSGLATVVPAGAY